MHRLSIDFGFVLSESFKGTDIAPERCIGFSVLTFLLIRFALFALSLCTCCLSQFLFFCLLDKVWIHSPMLQADSMSRV